MAPLPFTKAHGLGNDFVIIDTRQNGRVPNAAEAARIADRRRGVGFDQLIVIAQPSPKGPSAGASRDDAGLADARLIILNADGSEAEACGNGTRCAAWMLMQETRRDHLLLETAAGLLDAELLADGRVSVDMGLVGLDWREIPLAKPMDTLHLDLVQGPLADPVAVNIGNPHCVFFVDDAGAIDIERLGPAIERHPLFPSRTNVEVATVLSPDRIRMRVWERGVGVTLACGSGACATLVAAARRKLTGRHATIVVDGGELEIEWLKDQHVRMTGPVAISYSGTFDPSLLNG
ncbi:MAG: diaminopimelate epimerase [Rhodospirillaceae bacterium]|nr:diaminopimelate epimerase [Rhodospirillaceae bacterium]